MGARFGTANEVYNWHSSETVKVLPFERLCWFIKESSNFSNDIAAKCHFFCDALWKFPIVMTTLNNENTCPDNEVGPVNKKTAKQRRVCSCCTNWQVLSTVENGYCLLQQKYLAYKNQQKNQFPGMLQSTGPLCSEYLMSTMLILDLWNFCRTFKAFQKQVTGGYLSIWRAFNCTMIIIIAAFSHQVSVFHHFSTSLSSKERRIPSLTTYTDTPLDL